MRLVLSRGAARQLAEILDYVAERNPQGARRVQERVQAIIYLLLQHPMSGAPTDEPGIRRMLTIPYPYAIFYRLRDDDLIIQRIRHTARRPVDLRPGAM